MIRKYPVGIQNFEDLRKEGYCYVDKTELMYQLVQSGKYYFLSRPRRFGKSLLLSTIQAYFEGKKELFHGLAVEQLEQEWNTYPVLHLDLNPQKYDSAEALRAILNQYLESWETIYGDEKKDRAPEERFAYLIEKVSRTSGQQVVVLIDEYDKPMLQAIGNEPLQTEYRNTLKAFYGVLKSCDKYLRFAMLTGVTKFSKVSVFSDLNNLMDISLSSRFASICGITEQELHHYFKEDIRLLGESQGTSPEETSRELKQWYDGYHFSDKSEDIYNPFSLLNTFAQRQFGSYWFETGTPTFLVELLKHCRYDLNRLTQEMAMADSLNGMDSMEENPVPILYQSGYLTIKDFDREFRYYTLGFPNKEVEEGFTKFLLPHYAHLSSGNTAFELSRFVQEVRGGQTDAFMKRLQSFFADCPYELARDLERHYQNVLFIVFKLLGFYTQAKYHTSEGRIDLVVQTTDYIYVMEFKLEGTAEEVLRQINEKHYALPFASDSRKLFKIGVNFSNAIRGIEKWLIEEK